LLRHFGGPGLLSRSLLNCANEKNRARMDEKKEKKESSRVASLSNDNGCRGGREAALANSPDRKRRKRLGGA